ncbi:head portal vertex protein [Paraglaciecola Antarctic GD virus 1]|nr:head portal vertex protein [Paraglaciecola Antarctic GD virus 1]
MFDDVKLPFLKYFAKKEEEVVTTSASESFAAPTNTDGADVDVVDSSYPLRKIYGLTWDVNTDVNDEKLINQYRLVAANQEVDRAITEITDDAIVFEKNAETVSVDLGDTDFSTSVQERIRFEMENILHLYDFENCGWNKFRQWYIDGRQYHHIMIGAKFKDGIKELRELDPRRTRKVRQIHKRNEQGHVEVVHNVTEYFVYSQDKDDPSKSYSQGSKNMVEIRIPKDAIVYTHSGITGHDDKILSNLNKAVKNANQLRMVEDCSVIYRLARAPERRVFYVDVGKMPNTKAKQFMKSIMDSFNNKVVYNSATGKTDTKNDVNSIMEDYWLPRREGSKGTEISTLPGATSLGEIDDIEYFNRKLYEALGVPQSRFGGDGMMTGGRGSEITREELRFAKFIGRLQRRYQGTFLNPLRIQCILKGIITEDDWATNLSHINIIFNKDSYFEEQKELEILGMRLESLEQVQSAVGKYVSHEYVRKVILNQTEEDIESEDKLIAKEATNKQYQGDEDEM